MPLIPNVGRRRARTRLILAGIAAFLWLGVLLHLFPVAWMISASLKPTREIFNEPFRMIPKEPTHASYDLLFSTVAVRGTNLNIDVFQYPIYVYFLNSVLIAL